MELWSEPRAPLLPFHFFLSLPPLMSVSVSVQLYPHPTPEGLLPGLSPLPTGREALQPGFSGPSSWLQATFKEWGLSPHLLPPLPPVPPFSLPLWSIPGPAPKSASSHPHPHSVNEMDKPKGLGPETGPEQTHRWGPSPRQTDRHAAGTLRPRETSRS